MKELRINNLTFDWVQDWEDDPDFTLAGGYINQAPFLFPSLPHSTSSRFCSFSLLHPSQSHQPTFVLQMLSFRSIFVAATAFATITSAIPSLFPSSHVLGVPGGAHAAHGVSVGGSCRVRGGGGVQCGIGNIFNSFVRPTSHRSSPTKRGPTLASPGDIFKTCSDGVKRVVVKIGQYHISILFCYFNLNSFLDAAVNVGGGGKKIDRGLVIDLLGEIVVLLEIAVTDLEEVVVAELTLNGVACTLRQLAEVVTGLLIVRILYIFFSVFYSIFPFLSACYQGRMAHSVNWRSCQFHPLWRYFYHCVCYSA